MSSTPARLAHLQTHGMGALADGVLGPNTSIDAVWQHICEGLAALAEKGRTEQLLHNENGLTQRLVNELEGHAEYRPYFFHKEYMEDERSGKSPRGDIAVLARKGECVVVHGIPCAGGKPFLALEAKRLPTPGTGREREYLVGDNGGVARFKLGLHARELKTVGIIGYVQRQTFDYWRGTINRWVDELMAAPQSELPWDELDRLQPEDEETSPRLARLRSSNLRVSDNQRLAMRHIWVQLANEPAHPGRQSQPRRRKT